MTLDNPQPSNSLRRSSLCIAIIVLATVGAFWPVLKCDFVNWDDPYNVSESAAMRVPGLGSLARCWVRPAMGLYVPVTYTVWLGIAALQPEPLLPNEPVQMDPALFHAANLLVHVICVTVVWLILRRIVRDDIAALLGALLFALHPVQVESVAWVSGLKDVLSGFFALIAIWQHIVWMAQHEPPPRPGSFRYLLVLTAAGLAMLSKPSAMVLPLILVVLDRLVLARAWREIVRGVLPVFLVCLPCTIGAAIVQHPRSATQLWQRPIVVMDSLSFYVGKLLYPKHLAPDYGRRPSNIFHSPLTWWCWVIPLIVLLTSWFVGRRAPRVAAGLLIFIAGVLPTLGFVNTLFQYRSTVADHYLYLSMLGVALLIADLLVRWRKQEVWSVAIAAIILCGLLSFRQVQVWKNTETLFSHTLKVSPQSWSGRQTLAVEMIQQKRFNEAVDLMQQAVEIDPSVENYANLARVLLLANRPKEAIEPARRAVAVDPQNASVRELLRLAEHAP